MEFLRSFLKPHVSGSTKCRLFFSGYDLLSFFFQFELARKLKELEPIQINPLQRSRQHVLSATFNLVPSCVPFFGSAGQHQTHALGEGEGEELSYTVLYLLKLAGLSIAIANQMIVLTMEVLRVMC